MKNLQKQDGFSYIDVLIGMLILMVGILGLAGAMAANLVRANESEKQILAKQIALSTLESIFSAREIAREDAVPSWESIGNVGSNPVDGVYRGIFLTDFCPIREQNGSDGVAGTADDACPEGNNCVVGSNPPNLSPVVPDFERRIEINDVPVPLGQPVLRREIRVTIRYRVNSGTRNETVSTMIGDYK